MTLEEKAKEYAHNNYEILIDTINAYVTSEAYLEQGYLAGAKENSTQWHDLRKDPTDLPKRDIRFSTHISIPVLTQTSGFAFYQFDDKKWYFQGKEIDVIAWCEIPTFDKE